MTNTVATYVEVPVMRNAARVSVFATHSPYERRGSNARWLWAKALYDERRLVYVRSVGFGTSVVSTAD